MNSSLWRTVHPYVLGVALVVIVWSLSSPAAAQSLTTEQMKALQAVQSLTPEQMKSLQQFKALSQTGFSAMELGEWVRIQDWSYPLPQTSQSLTMEVNQKMDGWGNPFCFIQTGERVAVVSGGPSRFSCDALPLSTKQIVESKTDGSEGYFITESKLVVYVIRRVRNVSMWTD
jgi:hypothetical protein